MVEVEGKAPKKDVRFRIIVIIGLIAISGYTFYYFILPMLGKYESLYLFSYCWVANSHGEIRQLVVVPLNNGTEDVTLADVQIDGVRVSNDSWEGFFGNTIQPTYSTNIYVTLENFTIENGKHYNFTIVTSRKNHFNFLLNVNENNTKTEAVKISGVYFYHVPPITGGPVIGVGVQDLGGTDVIIKKALINDANYTLSPRVWLSETDTLEGFEVSFPWKKGENYTVTIETVIGTTANCTATAD